MSLTLVPPRKGFSRNYRIRGKVTAGDKSRDINETTRLADRDRAEAYRVRRENEILDELIHGIKPRHRFEEAAVNYAETLAEGSTQRLAIIGKIRKKDGELSPCLVSDFAGRMADMIDQEAVDQVIRQRFAKHKPGTIVRSLITPLTGVLNWAAKRGWCKEPAFDRPKFKDKRTRWASEDELARLTAKASAHFLSLLLFLILTGCRLSEAFALEWEDVDLAARWLVFRNTKREKQGEDAEGEDRGVPIHPQLVIVLANLPVPKDGKRTGRVFKTNPRSPSRGAPYRISTGEDGGGQIKTAWAGTCRRAGVRNLRPHDLRHTCATRLLVSGVADEVRDEILGHGSTATGRRYAHVPRPLLIAAIDRLPWIGAKSVQSPAAAVDQATG
jgi:integrase